MKKKILWGIAIVILVGAGLFLFPLVKIALAANRAGFFEGTQMRDYKPDRTQNIKAISTALGLAYESDGQFPNAKDWMDTLMTRLKTNDLTDAAAKEKLHRPDLAAGQFGYALNPAVAGKARSEIKDPVHTPAIFESKTGTWNASSDPATDAIPGSMMVMADGSVSPAAESDKKSSR